MLERLLPTTLLLALSLCAPAAHAALRSPQVPVSGTVLQTFFTSQGQAIDVASDQLNLTTFALINVGMPAFAILIHPKLGQGTLYAYNAGVASPPLFAICPGGLTPGWYTTASMRTNPDRLVVDTFDGLGSLTGTVTYLGANGFNLGLAVDGPSGIRFSEDALNPGGLARVLSYAGTGGLYGAWWVCAEDQESGTGDFADSVFLIEGLAPVPVQHASWGTLKERFR